MDSLKPSHILLGGEARYASHLSHRRLVRGALAGERSIEPALPRPPSLPKPGQSTGQPAPY